jgi:molybdopterin molybdotransferase
MESFFKVKRPEEVLEIIDQFGPSGEEQIPLEQALGRVLSKELIAPENLPDFFRSTMDGYAVQAKGTFGASESIPAGMLPEGSDGVVMVEYCHLLDEKTLEISRTISPLENVIQPGDDFGQGDVVFKKGRALRTQDLGLMAGFGQSEITVYKKPKIAIISTGDEIVAIDEQPLPGQVRDINRYTLSAFCRRVGAEPLYLGLCPDDFEKLKDMVEKALVEVQWEQGTLRSKSLKRCRILNCSSTVYPSARENRP